VATRPIRIYRPTLRQAQAAMKTKRFAAPSWPACPRADRREGDHGMLPHNAPGSGSFFRKLKVYKGTDPRHTATAPNHDPRSFRLRPMSNPSNRRRCTGATGAAKTACGTGCGLVPARFDQPINGRPGDNYSTTTPSYPWLSGEGPLDTRPCQRPTNCWNVRAGPHRPAEMRFKQGCGRALCDSLA